MHSEETNYNKVRRISRRRTQTKLGDIRSIKKLLKDKTKEMRILKTVHLKSCPLETLHQLKERQKYLLMSKREGKQIRRVPSPMMNGKTLTSTKKKYTQPQVTLTFQKLKHILVNMIRICWNRWTLTNLGRLKKSEELKEARTWQISLCRSWPPVTTSTETSSTASPT